MKRLALLAFALVMACGDDGGDPPVGAGRVEAKIDNVDFSGTLAVQATRSGNLLSIGAVGSNTRQINLNLVGVTTTGTIQIGAGNLSVGTVTVGTSAWTSTLTGGTGSVTLTTLSSTRAIGTFSFTALPATNTGATGNKSVTNGSFDVSF
ncbi:MAG: hypothetical protein ACO1Q7_18995 [Gemmatimonas sp.]